MERRSEVEGRSEVDPGPITDGRRRKGERRRRLLIEATLRVIGRDGAAAVSQRAVAAEAQLPASAVTYYFATVDDLLVATLTAVNDDYLDQLAACAGERALERLAELIAASTRQRRAHIAAEYELFVMAARRPDMRDEATRWNEAVDAFLAPLVPDQVARAGVAAAVDGLFLRCFAAPDPTPAATILAILNRMIGDE